MSSAHVKRSNRIANRRLVIFSALLLQVKKQLVGGDCLSSVMLESSEAHEAKKFSKLTRAQRKDWTPNDWYAWALHQYTQELERVRIPTNRKKVSGKHVEMGALAPRLQGYHRDYADEKSKATNALSKARQAATTKRPKQDSEERGRRAQYSGIV
jgi:hypothetical protein